MRQTPSQQNISPSSRMGWLVGCAQTSDSTADTGKRSSAPRKRTGLNKNNMSPRLEHAAQRVTVLRIWESPPKGRRRRKHICGGVHPMWEIPQVVLQLVSIRLARAALLLIFLRSPLAQCQSGTELLISRFTQR